MRNIYDPAKTYNIDDFLAMRNVDNATYYNFSMLEKFDGVEHLEWNLTDDYLEDLPVLKVELDDDQYRKYKYHPDILAYDVYGSTQLDFLVLAINDMLDPKEFIRKKLLLPFSSALSNFLDQVHKTNGRLIQQNRTLNGIKVR